VEKILWLRQQYHFGPGKITMYLKRYPDVTISTSGVWRILKKVGLNRLPASQRYKRTETRWKRYEKQRPGHALQVDVKFIEPLGQTGRKKRYYQYTAIDDCTRLRVLRAYPTHDQKTAIRFIDHVLSKLPFKVEKVQTDNGSEFGQSFHWHLLDKGIGHIRVRPATPRLNGKVERSHRIDSEEFYRLLEDRSSTTSTSSTTASSNGKTTTTTIDHTEPSPESHPTNDSSKNPGSAVINLRQLHI
jgi:transposase InsO family protein